MYIHEITDETRHYVDAILNTFCFPNRVNDIRGAIENVLKSENGDTSDANIFRVYFLVINFLSENEFGHAADYVYIIDKKGNDLKECGSLSAYEKQFNS